MFTTVSCPNAFLCTSADCYFWDDPYALTTAARADMALATDGEGQVRALQLCLRAAKVIRADSRSSVSKPVRIVTICEVCAVCIKLCLRLLEHAAREGAEVSNSIVLAAEECLAALLKWPVTLPRPSETLSPLQSDGGAAKPDIAHIWTLLAVTLFGLKDCRRMDAFEFRSVYRLSRTIYKLSKLLTQYPQLQPVRGVTCDTLADDTRF